MVDLNDCDREPIHVPGTIQPFGVLLALDPEELHDVKGDFPDVFARMREQLFAWILEDTSLERDDDDRLHLR